MFYPKVMPCWLMNDLLSVETRKPGNERLNNLEVDGLKTW
jgi:hypothetical protein